MSFIRYLRECVDQLLIWRENFLQTGAAIANAYTTFVNAINEYTYPKEAREADEYYRQMREALNANELALPRLHADVNAQLQVEQAECVSLTKQLAAETRALQEDLDKYQIAVNDRAKAYEYYPVVSPEENAEIRAYIDEHLLNWLRTNPTIHDVIKTTMDNQTWLVAQATKNFQLITTTAFDELVISQTLEQTSLIGAALFALENLANAVAAPNPIRELVTQLTLLHEPPILTNYPTNACEWAYEQQATIIYGAFGSNASHEYIKGLCKSFQPQLSAAHAAADAVIMKQKLANTQQAFLNFYR